MLMHAIAHEGCTDTGRESALIFDSGRNLRCRTVGGSNRPQRRAGPTLYQLSYIPAPWKGTDANMRSVTFMEHDIPQFKTKQQKKKKKKKKKKENKTEERFALS